MDRSTSAYICLLFCIFCFATSVESNNCTDANEIDASKILLSFYTCNATDQASIDCLIQDLNCIENAYKLINKDKRENTVFIHGYSRNKKPIQNIISAYCSRNISTIALLNWTQLQPKQISLTVTNWTSAIGRIAASTFDTLKIKGYNVETWHLIGHSMGAHIAGCIGTYTNFSWLHITGLDPAGVVFYTDMYKGCQINPDVANLTDVFYTDGNGYGTIREVGKLNIYANTGTAPQPGCCSSSNIHYCGHFKAIEWYADAVRNGTRYSAIKCTNCFMFLHFHDYCKKNEHVYLGSHINKKASGNYCLAIN